MLCLGPLRLSFPNSVLPLYLSLRLTGFVSSSYFYCQGPHCSDSEIRPHTPVWADVLNSGPVPRFPCLLPYPLLRTVPRPEIVLTMLHTVLPGDRLSNSMLLAVCRVTLSLSWGLAALWVGSRSVSPTLSRTRLGRVALWSPVMGTHFLAPVS